MGLWEDTKSVVGSAVDAVGDVTSGLLYGNSTPGIYQLAKIEKTFTNPPWEYDGKDWHKVYPYQFRVAYSPGDAGSPASGGFDKSTGVITSTAAKEPTPPSYVTYTMPIPPQSLITKMIPASSATPTIGGVVEETSQNVFWTIQMSGTTGVAVSRDTGILGSDNQFNREKVAKKFRKTLSTTGLLDGKLADASKVLAKVGGVADSVITGFKSGNLTGAAAGVIGALSNLDVPSQPYGSSAVDGTTNGFTEMQELHRFLYTFSALRDKNPDKYSLHFFNFKTQQRWRIILQDFTIHQSANNPYSYRYSIQMKCWDVQQIDKEDRKDSEYDRFGAGGDLQSVNTAGVGMSSFGPIVSAWKATGLVSDLNK